SNIHSYLHSNLSPPTQVPSSPTLTLAPNPKPPSPLNGWAIASSRMTLSTATISPA
ncbi:hypothetical protein C7212DRAFT_312264, partial [Tuber magnatum]